MNIIYIKQAVKVKVNKRDTEKAILTKISDIIGEDKDNIEYVTINTGEIPGIQGGSHVMLVSDKKLSKYVAISLGASSKDILCVTDDGEDSNYSFEYVLHIDKKITNEKRVTELLDEIETNKDLYEALKMIGSISTHARFETSLSGNYGKLPKEYVERYSGLIVVDCLDKNKQDINIEVLGRKGKLHLLQLVPVIESEMEIVEYLDDQVLNELIALAMIKNKKGVFTNRKKSFNFATVLPIDSLSEQDFKSLNIPLDKNNKPVITKLNEVKTYIENNF